MKTRTVNGAFRSVYCHSYTVIIGSQIYCRLPTHSHSTYEMTPGLKPFTVLKILL